MSYNRVISEKVTDHLRNNGLRQKVLVEALGLAQPNVSNRLRGKVPWTVADLENLHEKLGLVVELPAVTWSQSDE